MCYQGIKVSENLAQAEINARTPKTGFYVIFLNQTRSLCVITN